MKRIVRDTIVFFRAKVFTSGNFRKLIIGLLIFIRVSGCGDVFGTGAIIYIYVHW